LAVFSACFAGSPFADAFAAVSAAWNFAPTFASSGQFPIEPEDDPLLLFVVVLLVLAAVVVCELGGDEADVFFF
jgi:hypothetical protein